MILSLLVASLCCGALLAPLATSSAEVESTPHVSVAKRNSVVSSSSGELSVSTHDEDFAFVIGDTYYFSFWMQSGEYWDNGPLYNDSARKREVSSETIVSGSASLSQGPTSGATLAFDFYLDFIKVSFTFVPSYTNRLSGCTISLNLGDNVYVYIDPFYNGDAFLLSDDGHAVVFDSKTGSSTYSNVLSSIPTIVDIPDAMTSNPVGIVQSLVAVLVAGLTQLGTGLGAGISGFVQSLAFADGALSIYFVMVLVFGGIALAVGLTTKIFNWLTNLGN